MIDRNEPKIPRQTPENDVNVNADDPVAEKQAIEETKNVSTVMSNENDVNNESDWRKPVSLKGFKKKLNEVFAVKSVPIQY